MARTEGGKITVYLNDAPLEEAQGITLGQLLARHGAVPAGRLGVAVAVDGAIVRRADWPDYPLRDGMRVLVISVAQGG